MSGSKQADGWPHVPDDLLLLAHSRIATACMHAGLHLADAEDVAQDIWEWLVRTDNLAMALLAPWLTAVVANFIRRYWRSSSREAAVRRELRRDSVTCLNASPTTLLEAADARLFLDRLASRSPEADRKLLVLMRLGASLGEAARKLGMPSGSQHFHLKQLQVRAKKLGHPLISGSFRVVEESVPKRIRHGQAEGKTYAGYISPCAPRDACGADPGAARSVGSPQPASRQERGKTPLRDGEKIAALRIRRLP